MTAAPSWYKGSAAERRTKEIGRISKRTQYVRKPLREEMLADSANMRTRVGAVCRQASIVDAASGLGFWFWFLCQLTSKKRPLSSEYLVHLSTRD